jgi:hypothetical protein
VFSRWRILEVRLWLSFGVPLLLFVYLVPLKSYTPSYHSGNDVVVNLRYALAQSRMVVSNFTLTRSFSHFCCAFACLSSAPSMTMGERPNMPAHSITASRPWKPKCTQAYLWYPQYSQSGAVHSRYKTVRDNALVHVPRNHGRPWHGTPTVTLPQPSELRRETLHAWACQKLGAA